ncbi:MAG: sensor histidine kinase [Flavobacteriales bacterium]
MKKEKGLHILLWALYSIVLYVFFSNSSEEDSAFSHAVIFWLAQLLSFYMNKNVLIPLFYERNKYLTFVFSIAVLLMGSSLFISFLEHSRFFAHSAHVEVFKWSEVRFESLLAHAFPSFIAVFISFFLHVYQEKRKTERQAMLNLEAEKLFLVQQINPHFLFNTLNNIYSLTISNNPKGSEAILTLSSMLDYSLYDAKKDNSTLGNEIKYISNYVELFLLRDEDISNVTLNFDSVNLEQELPPLLLLPFVENAIKHGNLENLNEGFLQVMLETRKSEIVFTCINSFYSNKNKDKVGGIGLANVSRRLELLYPNKHHLDIKSDENTFSVNLKLFI